MNVLFSSVIRGVVTGVMIVILMMSLVQPKYSKKITCIAGGLVIFVDCSIAFICYFINDLNLLTSMDLIFLTVLCFALKPLFVDNFMQWLYSYITVQNANMIVLVLSYYLSHFFPYPRYGNSVFRFLLFGAIILLFKNVIRPLYRQAVDHWNIYFYVAISIFVFFVYYIVLSGDVMEVLKEEKVPLLLLCLLSLAVYTSMFHSLKLISREYQLENENIRMKSDQNLLRIGTQSLNERIKLMNDYVQELNIHKHDQRHFNATILELIEQNNLDKAVEYLISSQKPTTRKYVNYCENTAINAVLGYYIPRTMEAGIAPKIKADIPENIDTDPLELAMVIANLLENAILASKKTSNPQIEITIVYTGQIIIQVMNSFEGEVVFDENHHPISNETDHGVGTKSVLAFCEKHNAQIIYSTENGIFRVRLIV